MCLMDEDQMKQNYETDMDKTECQPPGNISPQQVVTGNISPEQIPKGSLSPQEAPTGSICPELSATQKALAQPQLSGPCTDLSCPDVQSAPNSHQEEPASKRSRRSSSPFPIKEDAANHSQFSVDSTTATVVKDGGIWDRSWDVHLSDTTGINSSVGKGDAEELPLDDYVTEDYQAKIQQLPRQWELTELGAHYQADGDALATQGNSRRPMTFSLMSYNILSQDLIDLNPTLYTASSPESLDWQQRRCRLMAEIANHNADILSLQEVQEDHFFDYLKPRLEKLGYTGCYQKRTGDKTDGCAILWKEDKFHLLHSTSVIYCRGGLLDRDNIALLVELQPIRSAGIEGQETPHDPQDKMVVANTHLLFNPARGDIKLAQLMILFAEIDKHAYLGSSPCAPPSPSWDSMGTEHYCPVILSGDFNMEPYSDLYKFIINGTMKYEGLMVKDLSGQQEGWRGTTYYLQRHFLSPMYGVTDLCQYHSVVVQRLRQSYQSYTETSLTQGSDSSVGQGVDRDSDKGHSGQCDTEGSGRPLQPKDNVTSDFLGTKNSHCDDKKVEKCSDSGSIPQSRSSKLPPLMPSSSGCLSHRFNLFSAYRHKVQRLKEEDEVTTHHSRAECTVDFIFYSVDYKDVCVKEEELEVRVVEEGYLKLLGRYGLMSGDELDQLGGIPSSLLPSDHLCLLTKFLLL